MLLGNRKLRSLQDRSWGWLLGELEYASQRVFISVFDSPRPVAKSRRSFGEYALTRVAPSARADRVAVETFMMRIKGGEGEETEGVGGIYT